jgi:hypothetical protein
MIILERVTSEDFPGQVWTDESNTHVIVEETADTVRVDIPMAPGFYVRDEDGEHGRYSTLGLALEFARFVWGPVELGPARRLRRNVTEGRADEVAQFLLEYLAEYGTVGIDVRDLAENVLTLQED